MVFNTKIVKQRIYISENNGHFLGILRYPFNEFRHFPCNNSMTVKQTSMSTMDLYIEKIIIDAEETLEKIRLYT